MRLQAIALAYVTGAILMACGEGTVESQSAGPTITGVSTQSVVVGETIEFFGENILVRDDKGRIDLDDSRVRLQLSGTFYAKDGSTTQSNLTITPSLSYEEGEDGRQILTWRRFGPFMNPFTNDSRIGRFEGQVNIVREEDSGVVTKSAQFPLELDVGNSIVIESFQPRGAECSAPAPRALAGLDYRLRVRVSGIKATKFVYEVGEIGDKDGLTVIEHNFGAGNPVSTDTLGVDEAVIFNPIRDDRQFYVTAIRVTASDDNGNTVETAIPLTVHRPVEVRYNGTQELAQVYEPQPVSGCQPGTIGGEVSYEESETETKQRSVTVTVSNQWRSSNGRTVSQSLREGISVGESESQTMGSSDWEGTTSEESMGVSYDRSTSNDMNFSTNDGETWGWSVNEGQTNEEYAAQVNDVYGEGNWKGTVGATAEGSVPGFAKATGSVETSVGVTAGTGRTNTTGARNRISREAGYSTGGSSSESRSFGTTTAERESQSLSGSYALSSSRQVDMRDTEARNNSRTWNLGSGTSESETISEGISDSESSTWQTSESLTTSQSYSGKIPRTKSGQFFRQTSRFVKRAEVRTYDMCGLASHAGELQFNQWEWALDLAIGDNCSDSPPQTQLPSKRCYIDPCDG